MHFVHSAKDEENGILKKQAFILFALRPSAITAQCLYSLIGYLFREYEEDRLLLAMSEVGCYGIET